MADNKRTIENFISHYSEYPRYDDSGDVRNFGSLADAITAKGSTPYTLFVANNQVISTAVTVPSNITIMMIGQGKFTKSGSGTLSINGRFISPNRQVFSGFSAGNVTFGVGSVKEIYPEWWGENVTPGTTNMTTPLQSALNSTSSAPVVFHDGTYLVDTVTVSNYTTVLGAGIDKTIIKQGTTGSVYPTASYAAFVSESASSSVTIDNLHYADFTINGQVATKTFLETDAQIILNGVKDVLIERVKFLGFRGDGVILGRTPSDKNNRNYNVTIKDCIFDGVNKDNRNGISVLDGDGVTIEGNYFTQCSKSDMPGPIDIEPDSDDVGYTARRIKILNNIFVNNGGSNGSISLVFPDVSYTRPPTDFLIQGNSIISSTQAGIYCYHAENATTSRNHSIRIINNYIYNSGRGFIFYGINNAYVYGNMLDTISNGSLIGYSDSDKKNINIRIVGNLFKDIGSNDGVGINIYTIDHLVISGNDFISCGKNDANSYAVLFSSGTSTSVAIIENKFRDPGSMTNVAIVIGGSHTTTASLNKFYQNEFYDSLVVPDVVGSDTQYPLGYTPVVSGETSAGTATYTIQSGRYVVIGKLVTVWVVVAYSSHTGTGNLKITLPIASSSGASSTTVGSVMPEQFTYTAGSTVHPVITAGDDHFHLIEQPASTVLAIDAQANLYVTLTYEID